MQNDVTYLAIILGLFALMFLLVKACDLIIGSDEEALDEQGGGGAPTVEGAEPDREMAA